MEQAKVRKEAMAGRSQFVFLKDFQIYVRLRLGAENPDRRKAAEYERQRLPCNT
jgi:hypothetical protein